MYDLNDNNVVNNIVYNIINSVNLFTDKFYVANYI